MTIGREEILQRKSELEQHRLEILAELNATIGAIDDCAYWLSVIDRPDEQQTQMAG